MNGEKKSTLVVQGTSIPTLSEDIGEFNSIEFEGIRKEIKLSINLYERGVTDFGFARIRSRGDTALFGGHSTQEMKDRMNVPAKKPLASLSMVVITARDLAAEITNFNVVKEDMQGEEPITTEHVQNNQDVRALLIRRGIVPENLPPEEDLKKLERKAKTSEKRLANTSGLPVEKGE